MTSFPEGCQPPGKKPVFLVVHMCLCFHDFQPQLTAECQALHPDPQLRSQVFEKSPLPPTMVNRQTQGAAASIGKRCDQIQTHWAKGHPSLLLATTVTACARRQTPCAAAAHGVPGLSAFRSEHHPRGGRKRRALLWREGPPGRGTAPQPPPHCQRLLAAEIP